MHEASIAIELVQVVSDQALLNNATRVLRVGIQIGELSSVIPEALEFVWNDSTLGTICEGATLEIERVKAKAICPTHGVVTLEIQKGLRCPICNTPTPSIVQGEELELDTLELL
jgi:hydrogenase nickel incorporation protein HypA/HybF